MMKLVDFYFNAMKVIIAILLVGMVVLVFGNVVLRYAFNSGITISEELARWFFLWMVFFGSLIALREHAHLGIDSLVKKLPRLGRKVCFAVSHSLMIYICYLFALGSWQQTIINLHTSAVASGLSVGLYYGIGVLFAVTAGIMLVVELFNGLTGRIDIDALITMQESEEA
jgi:TRAP-type transport system small permease protein